MKQKKSTYLHIGILIVLTALLYGRSLNNEFLFKWDDQWVVINTYTEQGFTWHNLWRVLTDFYHGQYAPLNELLYMTVFSISGYNPMLFHAATIAIHVGNVLLVYFFISGLLWRMCSKRFIRPAANGDARADMRTWAFMTALLFAVHPVCVESVSWLSASKILVYSFYYLIGLCLYLRYTEKRSKSLYLMVLLLFIMSFGGKEQAVVFFLSCLLVDYATGRHEGWRFLLLEKLPFILLSLFFGFITIMSQWGHGSSSMPNYDMTDRFILACYSLYEYMMKALIPINLSYIYPFPFQPGEIISIKVYLYIIFVLVLGYGLYIYRHNRLFVFAILFFVVNLIVALHIIPISRFAVTADRYAYLALIAPCMILAGIYVRYMHGKSALAVNALFGIYIIFLVATTFTYEGQWKNSTTLKQHMREILNSRDDIADDNEKVILPAWSPEEIKH